MPSGTPVYMIALMCIKSQMVSSNECFQGHLAARSKMNHSHPLFDTRVDNDSFYADGECGAKKNSCGKPKSRSRVNGANTEEIKQISSNISPGLSVVAGILAFYFPTFALISRNSVYQQTIMDRLKAEQPLDDIVHQWAPLWMTEHWFRRHTDSAITLAPLVVIALAYHGASDTASLVEWLMSTEVGLLAFVLEFGALGLYKQIVCFSTRLTPATKGDNIRTMCGVPTSSWTDYGISGHTGMAVLVFMHLRTPEALLFALAQTVLMVVVRDHYTLDVLHAWTFCVAVIGKFDSWVV